VPNALAIYPTVFKIPWDDFYLNIIFDSVATYQKTTTGSATIVSDEYGLLLSSGATINSMALIRKYVFYTFPLLDWSKKREFITMVNLYCSPGSGGMTLVYTGNVDTFCGFGFKLLDGKLYAHTGSGAAETNELITNYGAGAFDLTLKLRAFFTPGVSVQFYVNDVLVKTITTTLPAGSIDAQQFILFMCENLITTNENNLNASVFSFWQEA
jgi:hypothetical protein